MALDGGSLFGSGRRRAKDPGLRKTIGGGGGNGGGGGGTEPPVSEFVTEWENDPVDTVLNDFADIGELLTQNPSFNQFILQYANQPTSRLHAKVDSSRWLHFHYDAIDNGLARIEAKIEQNTGHAEVVKETRSTTRVHLNSELIDLKNSGLDGTRFIMFSEWKVRPQSTDSFRFMLRWIVHDTHSLRWQAQAFSDASDPDGIKYWQYDNTSIGVPIGQDFVMEIYYLAGDDTTGRLVVKIDLEDGNGWITIFDITDWTDWPGGSEIKGVQNWYPMMLYFPNGSNTAQYLADNDIPLDFAMQWWAADTGPN